MDQINHPAGPESRHVNRTFDMAGQPQQPNFVALSQALQAMSNEVVNLNNLPLGNLLQGVCARRPADACSVFLFLFLFPCAAPFQFLIVLVSILKSNSK